MRFGKWVAMPEPHEPSMHELWYRLEACGSIDVKDHKLYPHRYRQGYSVVLHRQNGGTAIMAIEDTFYGCLYTIYRRIAEKEEL